MFAKAGVASEYEQLSLDSVLNRNICGAKNITYWKSQQMALVPNMTCQRDRWPLLGPPELQTAQIFCYSQSQNLLNHITPQSMLPWMAV